MGFFSAESKSTTRTSVANTNNAIAASQNAIVNADRTRTTIHGGVSSDPEVILAALNQVTEQSNRFNASLTDIFEAGSKAQLATALASADAQKSFLNSTFDQLTSLAKNAQTGGESDRNRIVLYGSIAALLAVATIFILGKK